VWDPKVGRIGAQSAGATCERATGQGAEKPRVGAAKTVFRGAPQRGAELV
jgi:hypothetical protein